MYTDNFTDSVSTACNPISLNAGEFTTWTGVELTGLEYQNAWMLQQELVHLRKVGKIDRNIVLFLEHLPVFTLGRRGGKKNLAVSDDFLEKKGISVIQVERGGDITYHGPGQLVVYPIIHLDKTRLNVEEYVHRMEEVMIRTAEEWKIRADRNPMNRGVWVNDKKMGSIGIAIRRGITFHGFSLNINNSMEPFTWINPCGLAGIKMTSISNELGYTVSVENVYERVKCHIEQIFGVNLKIKPLTEITQG